MKSLISALILVTSSIVAGQRPSFAGLSPIGYPILENRTTTTPDPLADRFGEQDALPIEANGDRDLIDRLSKLPVDKQPFWFINWQAYDKHRKEPQTFPQRPNPFVDPIPQGNNGFQTPSPASVNTVPNVLFNRFAPTTVSSQPNGNFNTNANLRPDGVAYPNSNVYPGTTNYPSSNVNQNSNSNAFTNSNSNVYPSSNSNVYPNSNSNVYPNSNSNVYPNSNSNSYPNSNSNVYPNSNSNVYPNSNSNAYPNSNSNVYPNSNSNVYPNSNSNAYPNSNSNSYPNSNSNTNVYPGSSWNVNVNGNSNSNAYPNVNGNSNSNTYPNLSTNTNNYPAVNPNSNEYQTSSFNSNSNSGTVNKNGTFIQTTQRYQWTTSYKTTKVGPTNINNYPDNYPQTNTSAQRSGHQLF